MSTAMRSEIRSEDERKVLIVDDERDFVLSLSDVLESRGYLVEKAYSAEEVERKARCLDAQVALVDLSLGKKSGLDVISFLKANKRELVCLIVTAYADTDSAVQALQEGAYDYLRKPIEMLDLLNSLDRCFERVRLEREKLEALEALREERDRAKRYLEIAGVIILIVGADQRVILVNKKGCEVLGYSHEEIIGKNWFDNFIPGQDRDESKRVFDQLMGREIEPVEYYENSVITKSGERCTIAWHSTGLRDSEGRIFGTLSSGEDITERNRAEQELLQASKMASLGTLVSGMAHEINNPNNFIRLSAENLASFWDDLEKLIDQAYQDPGSISLQGIPYASAKGMIGDMLKGISEGTRRIEKLIKDLKDYARKDEGGREQAVNVNDVIASSIALVKSLIKESTSNFSCCLAEDLPAVRGNYDQIEQVIINLLINACQALEDKKQAITISTCAEFNEKASGWVTITVRDEGVGIPEEHLLQIVDPFFTTKRDAGGTGLGLSISYQIVNNHGGELSFSPKPGEGTEASVRLPLNESFRSEDT